MKLLDKYFDNYFNRELYCVECENGDVIKFKVIEGNKVLPVYKDAVIYESFSQEEKEVFIKVVLEAREIV